MDSSFPKMLREVKPKNARSARALAKQAPLVNENAKTSLFLKGTSSSDLVNSLSTDLHSLKRPLSVRFTKKNPIHPFENADSLEFFSQKNDASLLCFASHSKKRPHTLTFVRTFGSKVLDMLECSVVKDTARTLGQFKTEKCRVGTKPLLSFSGTAFDEPPAGSDGVNKFALAKSMFLDFFRGGEASEMDMEGLQMMISFAAAEEDVAGGEVRQMVYMRVWRIVTKRSGQKLPRVEVEEMGPRIDFRLGRAKDADEAMMKEALKKAKGTEVWELFVVRIVTFC
jgi:ribosome production factor 2